MCAFVFANFQSRGQHASYHQRGTPDRWMSSWTWGEQGHSATFSFSGLDVHSEGMHILVPILELRRVSKELVYGSQTTANSQNASTLHRGWTSRQPCSTLCKELGHVMSWHYVQVYDLPTEGVYRFGLEVAGNVLWLSEERRFNLQSPTSSTALRFSIASDWDPTLSGQSTFELIESRMRTRSGESQALVLLGDIPNADICTNSNSETQAVRSSHIPFCSGSAGYQETMRWFWMQLSRISSAWPVFTVAGNHDQVRGDWTDYLARAEGLPYRESNSPSPFFWATQIGPVYLIGMFSELAPFGLGFPRLMNSSYDLDMNTMANSPNGTHMNTRSWQLEFRFSKEQYARGAGNRADMTQLNWLRERLQEAWELKQAGRTAWTVILSHRNMQFGAYCSITHFEPCYQSRDETSELHKILERLFLKFEVDLHLSGHTHSYERTHAIFNFERVPNQPDSRAGVHMAPVYVVAPKGSSEYPGPPSTRWWNEVKPTHIAKRISSGRWGHLELSISPSSMRVEYLSRESPRDEPEVLDFVELMAPSRAERRDRKTITSKLLGGAHNLPVKQSQVSACRAAVELRSPVRSKRRAMSLVDTCFKEGSSFWRVLFDVEFVRRQTYQKVQTFDYYAALALMEYLWTQISISAEIQRSEGAPSDLWTDETRVDLRLVEFGLCLPGICDSSDIAGAVALPRFFQAALRFSENASLPDSWFHGTHRAHRCPDLASAFRQGVFADGEGADVPRLDVLDAPLNLFK